MKNEITKHTYILRLPLSRYMFTFASSFILYFSNQHASGLKHEITFFYLKVSTNLRENCSTHEFAVRCNVNVNIHVHYPPTSILNLHWSYVQILSSYSVLFFKELPTHDGNIMMYNNIKSFSSTLLSPKEIMRLTEVEISRM